MAVIANGARVCDNNRNALAGIDVSHTLANNTDPIIFALGLNSNDSEILKSVPTKWQWRRVGGSFADVTTTSEIKFAQTGTVLVDGTTVTDANRRGTLGGTFVQELFEFTATVQLSPAGRIRNGDVGEMQVALDFSGALENQQYEFQAVVNVGDVNETAIPAGSKVTTAAAGVVLTPAPVTANLGTAVPTVTPGPVTLTPDPVVSNFALPVPTVTNGITVSPNPVSSALSIPAPNVIKGGVTVSPDPAVALMSIPAPSVVKGGVTVLVGPVSSGFALPVPAVTNTAGGQTVTPSPVVATWAIPAPFIIKGGISANPLPVIGALSLPSVNAFTTSTPSNLGYLTFPLGGGLSKTFLPSGNTTPVVVEANAPSGTPQSGNGVIYQASGGVVTVHVWDGTQWLARVL